MQANQTAKPKANPALEQKIRPLTTAFRNVLWVVSLIFVFAVVLVILLLAVCNSGMKTASTLEHQGLPMLNNLASLQEDLAVYRLDSYEYLFARENEKSGKATDAEIVAARMRWELKGIKALLPEGEGMRLSFNLESAIDGLDAEFRNVRSLVDTDFAAAMTAMDRDIPPRTDRVDAAANALKAYGYRFSGGQANATFASFGSIKNNAIIFGVANILVAFGAVIFVRVAARRSRAQLLDTLAKLDEQTRELADSQALYQSLVDQIPAGIFRKDAAGRFVYANAWFCRSKKIEPNQFLGRTAAELAADEPQNSEAKFRLEGNAHHDLILQTGKTIEVEEEHSDKDGRLQYSRVVKSPVFDSAGKIVGSQGMFFDITASKEAEAALAYQRDLLRALLDSSPDAIYFKDADSRFMIVSNALAELLGVNSEAMVGKTDADFFAKEHAHPAFEDEQEIMRSGAPLVGKVEKEILKDGRELWALTSKMPLRDKEGRIIGTFGISKDITPMKQAEANLQQVHRQLLDTSRQAGMAEIATSVLHNIGNVLNSVNISASLVAGGVKKSRAGSLAKVAAMLREHGHDLGAFITGDAKGRQLPAYLSQLSEQMLADQVATVAELDSLVKNIEHIKDIVAMQQNYARVSGVRETVDICELVEDGLRMNEGALSRHRVEVVREFEKVPPMSVEKHKILQILVNLIRNAKHACDDSERADKRMTVRVAGGDGRVRVSVIDNGVGIPPENLTRIFSHGFTTRKNGHGFGLHSGALAAQEMHGSLTVQSDGPGSGATFTLELLCNTNGASHE